MNSLLHFATAALLTALAYAQNCDRARAGRLVELAQNSYSEEPLSEPTFTIHGLQADPLNMTDKLEQLFNRGMNGSEFYYKIKERKLAVTCTIKSHSTSLAIVQLVETTCRKSAALESEEGRQDCEFKANTNLIDCVWSGEFSESPFTYGFWCAAVTEEPCYYPEPDEICDAWRYKDTTAYRLPVPEIYRPWSVDIHAYQPPECVWYSRYGTRCTKYTTEAAGNRKEPTAEKDHYKAGRTGIRGRGVYRKLGENYFQQFLVLRKTESGDKQVLIERAAVDSGHLILPLFPAGDLPFLNLLGIKVKEEVDAHVTKCAVEAVRTLFKASKRLYGGAMWDSRNTDDAWLGLYSFTITDEDYVKKVMHGPESDFVWLSVNETTEAYLKNLLEEAYPSEMMDIITQPTDNLKEKLSQLKGQNIDNITIEVGNCITAFNPLVYTGLSVSDFLGLLVLSLFYFSL